MQKYDFFIKNCNHLLQIFGDGSVAQAVLSKGQNGTFLSINLAWGLAVMMAVHTAGGVSGKVLL